MKRIWKHLLLIVLVVFIVGGIIGYRMYHKPHENIEKATPAYVLSAYELITEAEDEMEIAENKYRNQILEVTGVVEQIITTPQGNVDLLISEKGYFAIIQTSLNSKYQQEEKYTNRLESLSEGDEITVKGVFIGIESLAGITDIKMINCFIM